MNIHSFISSLNNAVKKKSLYVIFNYNAINFNLCKIFFNHKFILSYKKSINSKTGKLYLIAYLNFFGNKCVLTKVKRVSSPSLPVYLSYSILHHNKIKTNHFFVISTSKGIISISDAMKYKIGGLVLLYAY
jgi:ribosomal protein S8